MKLVITCEHASAEIPSEYEYLFKEEPSVLKTHKGYDPGAFDLFQELKSLTNFSFYQSSGRLLIEVNRSVNHPRLFSRFSKNLDRKEKEEIKQTYYFAYRNRVEEQIKGLIESGEAILHISVHSFTPVLNGQKRNCDIGLLYDPARAEEKEFCRNWKEEIRHSNSKYKVRMNYPYLGKADGFTTYLRKKFIKNYIGIELEVNQKFVTGDKMDDSIKVLLKDSLEKLLH